MNAEITLMDLPENRRASVRLDADQQPLRIEGTQGALGDARLIDVSRTGLRFRSIMDLPIGSEVVVHPPAESGLAALRTRISRRIVLNESADAGVDYGAAFADPADANRHAWFLSLRKAA